MTTDFIGSALASATIAVAAGLSSKVVSGVFGTSAYLVICQMDWVTAYGVSNKQSSQFTLTFGTPAPPGGGHVSYDVVPLS